MKRRDFIRSGAGAFALAAAGRAFGVDAPSNRVRLAVIGCARTADHGKGFVVDPKGFRGRGYQILCRACELAGCEVACVCDVDRAARDYAASEVKRIAGNEPKKVRDFRDVLADSSIDGVIVATPDHSHVYIGASALKAGKALYLEKPIGVTAREAEVLRAVQEKTGTVFQLGTQRRSSYATRKGVELIRSGAVGAPHWAKCWCLSDRPALRGVKPAAVPEGLDWDLWQCCAPRAPYRSNVVHYNWRFIRGYGTGDLPNNGLHFVDIARWALGAEWPERVYAGGGHLFHAGADIGFACAGDADRLISCDEHGNIVDGDQAMGILALHMQKKGTLKNDTLVITVMSNLGLQKRLQRAGIRLAETKVGDRYVLENMLANGHAIGGEQSGHIILLDHNSTGDGMMSAISLLNVVAETKLPLSKLADEIPTFPQVLVNVIVANDAKPAAMEDAELLAKKDEIERKMAGDGRVLIRASGTEPLMRIMLEGKAEDAILNDALELAHIIVKKYNGKIKA